LGGTNVPVAVPTVRVALDTCPAHARIKLH
jgi:hypothetical protein